MCWRSGQTDCTRKERCVIIRKLKGNQARYSGAFPKQNRKRKREKKLGWCLTPLGESGLSFGMYGTEYAAGRRLEVENWTYQSTDNSESRDSRNSSLASHTAVTDSN